MQTLDLATVPLKGLSLIEASAGTGKTFTISNLVLRLVLSPQPGLKDQALKIQDILVVTFTKAATQELKDRIRQRISDAETYLKTGDSDDSVLKGIVENALQTDSKETVYERCLLAKLSVDDAPVFTIHGFCQRVLSDFAFAAGQPAEQSLLESNQDLLHTLATQAWREILYPLDTTQAALYQHVLGSPEALVSTIGPTLDDALDAGVSVSPQELLHLLDTAYEKAAVLWEQDSETVKGYFASGIGRSYTKKNAPRWLAKLADYLTDSDSRYHPDSDVFRFTQQMLDDKLADKAPAHPLFEVMGSIEEHASALETAILNQLRQDLMTKMHSAQLEQNIVFFDDLIKRVAEACSSESEASARLKKQLATRYPAALIDEFQDTDQYQYRIFQSVYKETPETCMMMIGDPKQAIYSFRGADINTYFLARDDVDASMRFTLDTNYRSQPHLVNGVNQLFLKQENPFAIEGFPEYPAVHSPDAFLSRTSLSMNGGQDVPVSVFTLDGDDKSPISHWRNEAARTTAEFIQSLLDNRTLVNNKRVEPKDIAVLVRKSSQAEIMKEALLTVGINSVFLSNDSVLETLECQQFMRLLRAVISPFDKGLICATLGDGLIGYDAARLAALDSDVNLWVDVQSSFIAANQRWKKSGFMVMWHTLIKTYSIAENLLAQAEGERRLTNLNQLAELFHSRENHRIDFATQLSRFQQMALEGTSDQDSQKMRLPTDANLVEIVTIHKSKGLEYPVVCCPFLFDYGKPQTKGAKVVYDAKSGKRQLHWQGDSALETQIAQEAFSEDVRLLYVALTRAADHLNLCWGRAKEVDKTALYALLYGRQSNLKELDIADFWQAFQDLPGWALDPILDIPGLSGDESDQALPALKPAIFHRRIERKLIARSYSAILMGHGATATETELLITNDIHQDRERDEKPARPITPVADEEDPPFETNIFHFPKGSEAGNFMHLVLEDVTFDDPVELPEAVEKRLEQYGFDIELWKDALIEHFGRCLDKPFEEAGCALGELPPQKLAKEMDFHLHALEHRGGEIGQLLAQYRASIGSDSLAANHAFAGVDGAFKGFIDLVFEHQGRYYVLDYKSNFLGFRTENYHRDALEAAIVDHEYDLQYLIYLAALQRYLRGLIPDYDYDVHIGGVYYLFLRGINEKDTAGIYFTRPEKATIDAFEALFSEGILL